MVSFSIYITFAGMIRPIALNIILLFVLCMSGVTAQAADDGDIVAYADVFAEFHDIAGYATGYWMQQAGLYQNRAVSVGATVYPFR